MTERIEQLERLVSLRDSGALTDGEFQREKARLAEGGDTVPPADELSPPVRRPSLRVIIVTLALAVAGAAGLALARWSTASHEADKPSATPAAATSLPASGTVSQPDPRDSLQHHLSPDQQEQLAFKALFGNGAREIRTDQQIAYTYDHGKIIWAPFGPILVLPADNLEEPSPESVGALGVFYLKEESGTFQVVRRWLDAVGGSSMGNPPEWKFATGFGPNPVIIATGGGVWQGYRCESTTVTELRSSGPVTLVSFRSAYENGGAMEDPKKVESITGEITNVRRNSFDVRFKGTRNFIHHYTRNGDAFIRSNIVGDENLPGC